MSVHHGQEGGRSRFGWARAVVAAAAVTAVLAPPVANAIPLGYPPEKEPPTPGIQFAATVLAFDPVPSGGGGGTGNS